MRALGLSQVLLKIEISGQKVTGFFSIMVFSVPPDPISIVYHLREDRTASAKLGQPIVQGVVDYHGLLVEVD